MSSNERVIVTPSVLDIPEHGTMHWCKGFEIPLQYWMETVLHCAVSLLIITLVFCRLSCVSMARFNSMLVFQLYSVVTYKSTVIVPFDRCREGAAMQRRKLVQGLSIEDIENLSDELPPITMCDLTTALQNTKPTVTRDVVQRHLKWRSQFGSEI